MPIDKAAMKGGASDFNSRIVPPQPYRTGDN